MCGCRLVRDADGAVDAFKHAQDGAGVITSLTETDGLIELPEDVTTVAPGATVGFLSYAALVGVSAQIRTPVGDENADHRPASARG